jgi:hypothetical protein
MYVIKASQRGVQAHGKYNAVYWLEATLSTQSMDFHSKMHTPNLKCCGVVNFVANVFEFV